MPESGREAPLARSGKEKKTDIVASHSVKVSFVSIFLVILT
ncbi:MAG: hypothetical protein WBC77_08335 [Candidatus Zixiibacteriota bacterium]